MAKHTNIWMAVSVLLLASSHLWAAHSEDPSESKTIRQTVRIYDLVLIDHATLSEAQKIADKIFKAVGVELQWVDGLTPSTPTESLGSQPVNPADIRFYVLWGPPKWSRTSGPSKCGESHRLIPEQGGGRISVSFACVQQISSQLRHVFSMQTGVAIVLGHLMAHEIGHLLMPSDDHSPSGIMQERLRDPEWALALRGWLGFTQRDAQLIWKGVQAREARHKGNPPSLQSAERG